MNAVYVFCEGLREVRFVQAVIEYILRKKCKPLSNQNYRKIEEEIRETIRNLLGRIEGIYRYEDEEKTRYIVVINLRGEVKRIIKEDALREAFERLEKERNIKFIFIADKGEYEELANYFPENCLLFNKTIEDFILSLATELEIDETIENLYREVKEVCEKYNEEIKDKKVKVALLHLILSGGECDKKMFATLFKHVEERRMKIEEIEQLRKLLSS